MSPGERLNRHPLDIALVGVRLSQLAIGVLGVLIISGEYSTGMIRASIAAVPKRLPVLWGKVIVFGLAAFALDRALVFAAFFGSQAILGTSTASSRPRFAAPGVARTVLGGALYLMVFGSSRSRSGRSPETPPRGSRSSPESSS